MHKVELTPTVLRKFGLVVGGVFLAIAGYAFWKASHALFWKIAAGFGGSLFLLGLLAPAALRPVYKGWMFLALILGWINTRLILGVVFYVGFVLARFYLLVRRKDPMERRPQKSLDTYWTAFPAPEPAESLEHPF